MDANCAANQKGLNEASCVGITPEYAQNILETNFAHLVPYCPNGFQFCGVTLGGKSLKKLYTGSDPYSDQFCQKDLY